jgi:hypothetical protein
MLGGVVGPLNDAERGSNSAAGSGRGIGKFPVKPVVHEGVKAVAPPVAGCVEAAAENRVVAIVKFCAPGELAGEGVGQRRGEAGGTLFKHGAGGGQRDERRVAFEVGQAAFRGGHAGDAIGPVGLLVFDQRNFFGGEGVKLIYEGVDLAVGGCDLFGERVFFVRRLRDGLDAM